MKRRSFIELLLASPSLPAIMQAVPGQPSNEIAVHIPQPQAQWGTYALFKEITAKDTYHCQLFANALTQKTEFRLEGIDFDTSGIWISAVNEAEQYASIEHPDRYIAWRSVDPIINVEVELPFRISDTEYQRVLLNGKVTVRRPEPIITITEYAKGWRAFEWRMRTLFVMSVP